MAEFLSCEQASDILTQAARILVTTHPQPDGDAIGSVVAACHLLTGLGKETVLYNPDPVPSRFRFLRGSEQFVAALPAERFDLTVVLDCSDERMFPRDIPDRSVLGRVLVIDHHKTLGRFGDVLYRDVQAAATGVLIYRITRALGAALTLPLAEGLYCSIFSDTGSFRYQNTDAETMRMAAELIDAGVDPWKIASSLAETRPRPQLDLLSRTLGSLALSASGQVAALHVTPEMLQQTGASPDMADSFVNYARALEGVEVGILLRPSPQGGARVSLRSRGRVDVSAIAQQYGGGGHHNAAGFTLSSPAPDLLQQLLQSVEAALTGASG